MTEQERRETESNNHRESVYRRERAMLLIKPHIVYDAVVWCTGSAKAERSFACSVYPSGTVTDVLDGQPIRASVPTGYGKCPAEACEDFDRLWINGEPKQELLPDKKCQICGASLYWVRSGGGSEKLLCAAGHEFEVQ